MKKVLNNLKVITSTDKIVVGVSGGEDSMCLLHLLIKNINKENIIVTHVNHNIRTESASELEFVRKYAKDNNLIFESTVLPNDKNYSENELRIMRYDFFENIINKYQAKYLLTAHHSDDLVETILMRLTRGSSLKGYAGIELLHKKDNYQILRPLICVTKDMITNYIKENNIPVVFDSSNISDKYTRNRYRHHIIPTLKEENPNIHEKYLQFSKELLAYYQYVDNIVLKDIEENGYPIYKLNNFNLKDSLIQRKVIEKILFYTYANSITNINNNHVEEILKLIKIGGNKELDLPLNKKIIIEYNNLYIISKEEFNTINETFDKYYENNNFILKEVDYTDDNSNYTLKIDSTSVSLPLHIRSIKDGDKMIVKNLNGHKKIKDILIDSKIPKCKRSKLIVVTDNDNEILWLPGIKKSQFDKSNNEKYDIIIKYSEKF